MRWIRGLLRRYSEGAMIHMKKAAITLILTALLLTSCNEVPEDVKSRTEEQNSRAAEAAEDRKALAESDFDPYAKVPFAEVKAELNGYKFKAHENLDFKCEPTAIDAENVYKLTMTGAFDTAASKEDAAKLDKLLKAVKNDSIDGKEIRYDGNETAAYAGDPDIDGIPVAFVYHNNTSFLLCDYSLARKTETQYAYYTLGNYPKEKLKMADGSELSVDEAIEQTDKYLKKLHEENLFDSGEDQKLYRVGIGTLPDGSHSIILRYQQTRYVIPVDESGLKGIWPIRCPNFQVEFAGSGRIQEMQNFASSTETSKDKLDAIIPLSSAEYLAADGLAEGMAFEVSDVELRYVCYSGDPDVRNKQVPTDPLIFRPMWVFTVFESDKKENNGQEFQRKVLYVDAESGELFYSDPANVYFFSNKDMEKPYV